jgi:ribosomal protein S4E
MKGGSNPSANIVKGDQCVIMHGKFTGKSGLVRHRETSASGDVSIIVEQADGEQFKTLARNASTAGWLLTPLVDSAVILPTVPAHVG